MRDALIQPRMFFGGLTYEVHVSHDWGALYCKDCGAWCAGDDDPATPDPRAHCTGPRWAWDQWRAHIEAGVAV